MNILRLFGFGEERIFALNHAVSGRITAVKKCEWCKINTKPVRKNMWDGAKFPHIATFVYTVDGAEYTGSKWIAYDDMPPAVGKKINVYIDPAAPRKYAVNL